MGIVRVGPPIELICKLKEACHITTFIETGTYQGNTAYWASGIFDHVITIEASKSLYEKVVEKYGHTKNIEFIHGDSREKLKGIIAKLNVPSIFWLDAHWSGGTTYGENDPCPLIEEIKIINSSEYEHFVLIDDARLFTSPPPDPHPIEQWPNICTVISAFSSSNKVRYIVIFEDVIIAVPRLARDLVAQYCQHKNTESWKEHDIVPDDRKPPPDNKSCKVEHQINPIAEQTKKTLRVQQQYARLLRKRTSQLMPVTARSNSQVEITWVKYRNCIRQMILHDDVTNFLNWDVIVGTMFHVAKIQELQFLQSLPDWSRWQIAVQESSVGNPKRYDAYRKSSGNLIHHAYSLAQLEQKGGCRIHELTQIVEFGGGYGSMCRLAYQLGFKGRYIIYDFPELSALQEYFLNCIGLGNYISYGDNSDAPTSIVLLSDMDKVAEELNCKTTGYAFIATWSLSEAPVDTMDRVLDLVSGADYCLIAYKEQFRELNNLKYFARLTDSRTDFNWAGYPIAHLPGNHYLIGRKKSLHITKPDNYESGTAHSAGLVDGVIFSKDRAMQLDATVRSFILNCKDHGCVNLKVIYKVSNSYHKESYNKLIRQYQFIDFIEEKDFREQLLSNLAYSKYVLFLVDDNIFVRDFHLSEIIEALQNNPDALGFSLRLGKNINYNYPSSSKETIPPFIDITGKVLKYDWTGKNRYFGYPLEVSSSVYRTDDILPLLTKLDFQSPNTLEAKINRSKNAFANSKKTLLCFQQSVAFCNPVNVVQDDFPDNRSGNNRECSPDSLAKMFNAGYKIDAAKFLNFLPSSCHQEVKFEFIKSYSESSGPGYDCPIVSIYMAVYNSEQYLAQTLDSILSQTFRDFEIIIADDGSTDNSTGILKRYEKADSRIRVLQLPHVGVVEARNEAIKRCNPNSKYLMNHDSDDISSPTKLASLVEYIETHPEIAIVGCFAEYFDDEANFKGQPTIEWLPERIRQTFGEVNSMIHSASLIRRQVFEKIGSYSKDFPVTQDYDFFARALMAGFQLANIPEVLHKIRLHPKSIGNKHAASVKIAAERVRKKYKSNSDICNDENNVRREKQTNFEEKAVSQKEKVNGKGLKLHLGCGSIKIPGFINVDIDPNVSAVDVVDDVCTLNRFNNNSTSLIYACHILEHFSHDEINPILKRWFEILEPGGELRISVPDIDRIVKVYINNWQHFQTPPNTPWIGLIYGGQNDKYDFHKTGFNFTYLKYLMEQAGFTHVSEYPHEPHWLGIKDASLANAPFNEYISLNIRATKVKSANVKRQHHRPKKTFCILHTVELYSPHVGGAELVVQQLSERLAKRGHNVTVATTRLAERTFDQLNGVQIEEFDVRGAIAKGFTGSDIARYQQFLLKHPADIMMNYAAQQWATDLAFDTLASTGNRRINIIAPCGYSALSDSKTLQNPQFADYFNKIIPTYLPKYDAAVYHSGLYQDYEFAQNHGFKNSLIIPNGVCEEEFSQTPIMTFRQKYKIATKYLGLCVANFYSGKGQDRIIECVRQMNRPDFTMVFIGKEGNDLHRLQRLASGLNVRFCVNIKRKDTLAAYYQADIFLFASEKECSPLVIIEAKASRTPFVTTDCGNVREWRGGTVCMPEKMAFYANKILDDETVRKSLAEEGWKEWKEKFTLESVVDKYDELYLQLYQQKLGPRTESQVRLPNTETLKGFTKADEKQAKKDTAALIFSKDRAMQLQAAIESFLLHCQDLGTIDLVVLYKTSNGLHTQQYEELKRRFSNINFVEESNFRTQVLTILGKFNYVLFLVDDNLFVNDFHLIDITSSLQENTDAAGFSLRLGKNTNYCYTKDSKQTLPLFRQSRTGILMYNWTQAEFDFGYPLELSSSIYRTRDILVLLDELEFNNPNMLECQMAANARLFAGHKSTLLCCENSLTFCNPVNKVQSVFNNRCCSDNRYSADALAELFQKGLKIDVERYSNFIPNACHQEVQLHFKQTADLPHQKPISTAKAITQIELPPHIESRDIDDKLLWIAANVPIKSDKLFELLANQRKKEGQPLVSIYMVTYNAQEYIAQAIESVLAQTYKNFELLIVNDGSNDATSQIIASYSDERICYIYKKHKNFASGMNRAIIEAKGKYIIGIDSDDFIDPDYIEKLVACAEKHPEVDYFYPAKFVLVDESGNLTGVEWNYLDFSDNQILPAFLLDQGYGPIPNPGSLKRRSLFTKKCELYKELETVEDFTFLCRNALRINFMRVQDHSTYFYRRMASGNSQKFKARNQLMARALNDMVLIYPPQVLYPQIRYISPDLREKEYYKYLMTTFYKHSQGNMVRYGEYFRQYGDYYKAKLLSIEEGNKVGSAGALSDQKFYVELFEQGAEHLKAGRPADALVCFDGAYRLEDKVSDLQYARAVALAQLGRMDDARLACEAELAIQPNHKGAQMILNKISGSVNVIN